MMIFPVFITIAYPIYALFSEKNRRINTVKTIIWVVVFSIIYGKHFIAGHHKRAIADDIVAQIFKYKDKNGEYPESLDSIGITTGSDLKSTFHYSYYANRDPQPLLFYRGEFSGFSFFHYNFDKKIWVRHDI